MTTTLARPNTGSLPAQPRTDRDALSLYATNGDPGAFEVLVARYQTMVYATCLRTLGNQDDAEDATQDTFVKLSKHAASIHSNLPAWLHACARRVSIDVQRRMSIRRKAEHASVAHTATENHPDFTVWARVEPVLDNAMERLSSDDRELIAARYLAGRPQAELAVEAGVDQGTISRRLNKALGRLRTQLIKGGLAPSVAPALLATAIINGANVQPAPALSASLAKVGLAGLAHTGIKAAPSATVLLATAAVVTIGALSLGGLLWMGAGTGANATRTETAAFDRAAADAELRPLPPARPDGRFTMTDLRIDGLHNGTMTSDGNTLSIYPRLGEARGTKALIFQILEAKPDARKPSITIRLQRNELPTPNTYEALADQDIEVTYAFDDDQLRLITTGLYPTQYGRQHIRWTGSRVVSDPAKDDTALAEFRGAVFPAIAGEWTEHQGLVMSATGDEIRLMSDDFKAYVFRILDWDVRAGIGYAQTICVDSWDPHVIGDRIKVILEPSRSTDGRARYTMLMHDTGSPDINRWPAGFQTANNRGMHVSVWKESE